MSDVDLVVRFNRAERVSFTRGEDRDFNVLLSDNNEGLPLDLTNAQLTLALPRDGGGTVKRRTGFLPFSFAKAQTIDGLTQFKCPGHGLCSGDVVNLQPIQGAMLPEPYSTDARYVVEAEDSDIFALRHLDGTPIVLAAATQILAGIYSDDFGLGQVTIGQCHLKLSAVLTQSISTGQGQSYQLTYRDAAGLTRIFAATAQLDVFAQPCP